MAVRTESLCRDRVVRVPAVDRGARRRRVRPVRHNRRTTAAAAPAAASVQLAPENSSRPRVATRSSAGPMISGQLTPAREATVRAQVGGSLVSLPVDRGQPVATARRSLAIAVARSRRRPGLGASRDQVGRDRRWPSPQPSCSAPRRSSRAAPSRRARSRAGTQRGLAWPKRRSRRPGRGERSVWQQLDDTSRSGAVRRHRQRAAGQRRRRRRARHGAPHDHRPVEHAARGPRAVRSDPAGAARAPRCTFTIRGVSGKTSTARVDRDQPDGRSGHASGHDLRDAAQHRRPAHRRPLRRRPSRDADPRRASSCRSARSTKPAPCPPSTRIKDGKAERVTVELGPRQPETESVEITSGLSRRRRAGRGLGQGRGDRHAGHRRQVTHSNARWDRHVHL